MLAAAALAAVPAGAVRAATPPSPDAQLVAALATLAQMAQGAASDAAVLHQEVPTLAAEIATICRAAQSGEPAALPPAGSSGADRRALGGGFAVIVRDALRVGPVARAKKLVPLVRRSRRDVGQIVAGLGRVGQLGAAAARDATTCQSIPTLAERIASSVGAAASRLSGDVAAMRSVLNGSGPGTVGRGTP